MLLNKNLYNIDFDFVLIDNQSKLQNFLAQINDGDIIAIDTEFTRRDTYFAILSTIQIAIKKPHSPYKIVALIDAIANIDLTTILAIICNPKITKIIHSSIQDLQIFYRLANAVPQNIVDTQIMANFCDENSNIGYANLVKQQFAVEICKKMQSSNWHHRPLKSRQIDYALADVIFLHEIYENFYKKLKRRNFYNYFCEEMSDFVNKSLQDSSENLIRNFIYRSKNNNQIAQIHHLILLREKYAKIYNLPREHLLKNQELIKIVENSQSYDFGNINFYQNFCQEIKNIIINNNLKSLIRPQNLSSSQKNKINKIKSLTAKYAKKYQIHEQFLLSSTKIKDMVFLNKIDAILNNWRKNILGTEIIKILNNTL